MELSLANDLVRPGERVVLDTPIDLSQITVDSYQVAGIADHITPWQSNYRSTQLLGSQPRFVLSTSGHIAVARQPARQREGQLPGQRLQPARGGGVAARRHPRTRARGGTTTSPGWASAPGAEKPARKRLGGKGYKPLDPAPGTYVLD